MTFDYIIVGAGLFGATVAERLHHYGKNVLVIEKKDEVGGMCATKSMHNIIVHMYGAHIFRTQNREIWNYVNKFDYFVPFINSPLSYAKGKMYNMPINMNTINEVFGIYGPRDAHRYISKEISEYTESIDTSNAEGYAISKLGPTLYNLFIKEYTEKQWGKPCNELPASILGRLPIRYTYDNNYYQDKPYQGIPVHGYSEMIENMLDGVTLLLGEDAKSIVKNEEGHIPIIYTGPIDEFYDYMYGNLEYRSLEFHHMYYAHTDNFQGNAVVNYPDKDYDYTRIIEHKHFISSAKYVPGTMVTYEHPREEGDPYYPMSDSKNQELASRYKKISPFIIFAGRLGNYAYYDMEDTIVEALSLAKRLLRGEKYETND